MDVEIITLFPEMFGSFLAGSLLGRACAAGLVRIFFTSPRDYAPGKYRQTDDTPYGGGQGMVMKPEPLFEAVESLLEGGVAKPAPAGTAIVLLSAAGKLFRQDAARKLAQLDQVVLICGRYEGVDERVTEHLATEEISIGDFVLSGGELPAAMILDAVTRLIPGALGNENSAVNESFNEEEATPERARHGAATLTTSAVPLQEKGQGVARGILDYPHYTRPQKFREWEVPDVLMSGNHEEIRRWRRKKALEKTLLNRPDLLAATVLSEEEQRQLREILGQQQDVKSAHNTR